MVIQRSLLAQERVLNLHAANLERKQRGVKMINNNVAGAHLRAAAIDDIYPTSSQSDLSHKLIGTTQGNSGALRLLKKALKNVGVIWSAFAPNAIRGLTTGEMCPIKATKLE